MTYVSFPGLGIEPFHMDKIAFTIFGRDVAWYGIIICAGIILAVLYSMWRAQRTEGINGDHVVDIALFLIIFGVIGARLYYVIFEFDKYLVTGKGFLTNLKETALNVIGIWNGGLAIYGAIIAGFFTLFAVCRLKKISFVKMLDVASPACLIGQLIGRWGNFVNVEAYGSETALPWRMGISYGNFQNSAEMGAWTDVTYVHPTFLYESIWNLCGFIIANIIYKKKKFDGQIFLFYVSWYGFGRMFIEGLRTDSLMLGPIRISQLVGFVSFAVGVSLTVAALKIKKKNAAFEGIQEIVDSAESENEDDFHGIKDEPAAADYSDCPDTVDAEVKKSEDEEKKDG